MINICDRMSGGDNQAARKSAKKAKIRRYFASLIVFARISLSKNKTLTRKKNCKLNVFKKNTKKEVILGSRMIGINDSFCSN